MKDSLELARLDTRSADFEARFGALLARDLGEDSAAERGARDIIAAVRSGGDAAVLEFTARFDGVQVPSLKDLYLDRDDFAAAFARVGREERHALSTAAGRISEYHGHQQGADWSYTDAAGNRLGQRISPLDRVGLYVPGGQAAYPSTVLMTAIPAKTAGVPALLMTVPTPGGRRNDLVLAAAHLAGVDGAFCIGGAQAIAALAYGTESVERVDKIVGPGGAYVAAAKRQVYGAVGIDLIAGPSEVLVIADANAPAQWLAWDLFSQAEHDAAAQALLLSPDADLLDSVESAMRQLLASQPRRDVIARSLADRGALILTRDISEALVLANRVAPEHLQLCVDDPESLLPRVRHAGAIFLGAHSPEVMGDYAAGPSHVLPTAGTARFSSPLGVYDFQKRSSVIHLSATGAQSLARVSAVLATGEGLHAHAGSAAARISGFDHNQSE
ncbi:MAG: histidinol dehydrogenase [Pseudomonadales bacterium]